MSLESRGAPQRILILTTSYPRFPGDSAGHFVAREAQALVDLGHEVTVLSAGTAPGGPEGRPPSGKTPHVEFLGGESLFAHPGALPRISERPLRALSVLAPTLRCLVSRWRAKRPRYDRIIAHWMLPCGYPWSLLAAPHRVPLELVAHGSDVRLLLRLPAVVRVHLLRALHQRRATLRFVSEELKDVLRASGLPSELEAFVAAALVEASPLTLPTSCDRTLARQTLAMAQHERLVLIVGRLISGKRPEVALSAAALIPDARVFVLGSGPLEAQLRGTYPQVEFLGQVAHPTALRWLTAADVVLSASRSEGAPTALREARALGTPVVSVSAGDLLLWSHTDKEMWVVD